MTTKPTYIYSDAECIIKALVNWPPEPLNRYDYPHMDIDAFEDLKMEHRQEMEKQAKSTAVRFADQVQSKAVLWMNDKREGLSFSDFSSLIKPDTIYTVEGYEVNVPVCGNRCSQNFCIHANGDDHDMHDQPCPLPLATLKRIEPVVELVKESWTTIFSDWCSKNKGDERSMRDSVLFSMWLEEKYNVPTPKQ